MAGDREARRFAVLTPFAANWLLRQVPADVWRRGVEGGALSGRPDLGSELAGARAQLEESAGQWRSVIEEAGSVVGTSEPVTERGGARSDCPPRESGSSREIGSARAAELLGVSSVMVTRLAREGTLRGRQVGRTWLIDEDSVIEYLQRRRSDRHEQAD